ncbi:AfsR/SARP family transcriptional regulator [Streptomyces erythrochromogenes]|uniref:AfsR/SARP family transcriptional regulator n=1 Tax=Streptomyces erythrochromogenes TaxID=285574 RepID=UPI000ADCB620|nr:BTAD domain-containing putative transcriptional regulator [Streptomyces erythrochromogenes]
MDGVPAIPHPRKHPEARAAAAASEAGHTARPAGPVPPTTTPGARPQPGTAEPAAAGTAVPPRPATRATEPASAGTTSGRGAAAAATGPARTGTPAGNPHTARPADAGATSGQGHAADAAGAAAPAPAAAGPTTDGSDPTRASEPARATAAGGETPEPAEPAETAADGTAPARAGAAAGGDSAGPTTDRAAETAAAGTTPGAAEPAAGESRFAVLGPVRAWRGGEALPSGTPQQRALLAVLLLRDGRTATAPELIDAIWGEDPPQQALATIRTYASRLRKVVAPGLLVTESGGYAIRLRSAATLDLGVARSLAADADSARAAGDRSLARTLLARALDLWEGEPLAGVPGPHAETERTRLAEWRLQLLETRLDLDLEVGHHAEAVSELTALTAAHPLRERLRELLMLALYRSGRQAEALAVYADTRRLLADELGVDPRPELAALQQRILNADADLARAEDPVPAAAAAPVRPAQLPATVPDFTGRSSFVHELGTILSGGAQDQVMAVSALAGIGGVGKTTLAVHVAHAARPHFPDGQLYVDLQGTDARPAEPEAVLGSFLRALGTPDTAIPDSPAERAALYRSTLDGRRVLVLLDNARDAAQVRPLLPGTAGCAALVTSRVRMAGLAGAHLVDLDVMSPDEALQLFTRIVGEERVRAERQAALDVVGACGFLPLAIRIAASRLAARRTWTVSVLAAKLGDERRRLDELQAGDLAVKATFELGYGQLEPAQQRAFRLLGLADGPDISLSAAAAVLDLPEYDTEDLLEALVDCSLLESAAPGRYRFHDLVRLYARACAERDEQPASEREAALDRLLDFYLATASGVYALERPGDRLPAHLSDTHYPGLVFAEPRAALDWLYTEAGPLLACVRQASVRGGDSPVLRRAVDLLWAAKDLAESGANSKQYESAATALRDAAQAAKDPYAEGRARTTLTNVHLVAGRFAEADDEARQATALAREAGDPLPSCWAPNDRGIIALYEGRHADGERYLLQAIQNFRADGNNVGEASALCNLSRIHVELGRLTSAIDLAQQGIAIYDRMGLSLRLANGRYALGIALTQAGRLGEALAQLTEALALFHDNRQPLWEGVTHFRLAVAHLAARRPTLAAAHAEQAIALRGIGGEWRRATVLGKALRRLGQTDRARACWRDAETVFKQLGSAELGEVQNLLATEIAA